MEVILNLLMLLSVISPAYMNRVTIATPEQARFLCQMQPLEGYTCSAEESDRYYFDQSTNRCEAFKYKGCYDEEESDRMGMPDQRNKNNFPDIDTCERTCNGAVFPFFITNPKYACFLQKNGGVGNGFLTRWWFDANEQECKEFRWTAMNGNRNRFVTRESCNEACKA